MEFTPQRGGSTTLTPSGIGEGLGGGGGGRGFIRGIVNNAFKRLLGTSRPSHSRASTYNICPTTPGDSMLAKFWMRSLFTLVSFGAKRPRPEASFKPNLADHLRHGLAVQMIRHQVRRVLGTRHLRQPYLLPAHRVLDPQGLRVEMSQMFESVPLRHPMAVLASLCGAKYWQSIRNQRTWP